MAKLEHKRGAPRVGKPGTALEAYRAKRDFGKTAEPAGGRGRRAGSLAFVVQKHAARRLHYDLRLELDDVLKSWAVTRGPSLVPGERRLAVHVEDHPLDYAGWEGVIPKGQYGGGTVIVWDRGAWVPEGDPHEGYARGRLTFVLEGERLRGRWHLVRTKPRGGKEQWLLIKSDDAFARAKGDPDVLDDHTTSVLSGRSNDDLDAEGTLRPDHAGRARVAARASAVTLAVASLASLASLPGARKGILPPFVEPCLATLSAAAPAGPDWLHEIKHDGYRLQARIDGDAIRLLTRSGLDWTEKFGTVAEALRHLAVPAALLDGELVVEDARGASSFAALQDDLSSGRTDRLVYQVFDLLYLNGRDLSGATLRDRKAALAALLDDPPLAGRLRVSEHIEGDGAAMARHACRLGLEGVVSKRADRPYRSGRGGDWLKTKCTARQELVIAGYAPSTVDRDAVGSLVLGVHEGGELVHVGRAGTGFTATVARALRGRLDALRQAEPPFAARLPAEASRGGVRWVEPRLVAEFELRGWTGEGAVRHAAYKGLREDKEAALVVRESSSAPVSTGPVRKATRLTHPDRVLWPEIGLTKQGLADYYEAAADRVLPDIVGRPLSLVRGPEGIAGKTFFQKHAWAGLDEGAVRRTVVDGEELLSIRDLDGLMALVQASVLEIHPWGSRLRGLDRPDRVIFDLDPGPDVAWEAVAAGAREIRARLEAAGLAAFVKTSGGKGLHVVAPLKPRADWDGVKAFASGIADAMAGDAPGRFVATMAKRARAGRIFVDIHRNGRGATAVAAYSTRARPGAPVSTPLDWDEVDESGGADRFRVETVPARLASLSRDPWAAFGAAAGVLPKPPTRRGTRSR